MAATFLPTKQATLVGTGSAATLISATNHTQAPRVWQILLANSSTGGIAAVFAYTLSGSVGTLTVEAPATSSVIVPFTGVPWILGDVNNTITCNAPTQATIQAYYD